MSDYDGVFVGCCSAALRAKCVYPQYSYRCYCKGAAGSIKSYNEKNVEKKPTLRMQMCSLRFVLR